jgi:hypothetical protein
MITISTQFPLLQAHKLRLACLFLSALAMCTIVGCSRRESFSWTERIRFHDGSEADIDRVAYHRNIWYLEQRQGCCTVVDQSLSFSKPIIGWHQSESGVPFRSLPKGPVDVQTNAQIVKLWHPFSLDKVGGVYILAGTPEMSAALLNFCLANPDKYDVFFLRWAGREWVQTDQSDAILDTATYNLLVDVDFLTPLPDRPSRISLKDKGRIDEQNFSEPITVRQYLEKYHHTCVARAASAGYQVPRPKASK